jgi:signal transduction histidine kinase
LQFENHMENRSILSRLLPAESDPKLREYLQRLSLVGVRALALVELAAPLLVAAAWWAVGIGRAYSGERLQRIAAVLAVATVTWALSRSAWAARRARALAGYSAAAAAALLISASSWRPPEIEGADDYILAGITLILLTAVATVPLLPRHTVMLGVWIETVYILASGYAAGWELFSIDIHSAAHHVFLVMLALVATGLSVLNYEHWRAEFHAAQEAVRTAEALTGAQLRAQLAENAISIGKMAAALSHEINSPVGALRSSIETVLAVTDRQIEAAPARDAALEETRAQLIGSIQESAARIEEVTHRLRRFVTLEEAEMKAADLNELLADVALLHQEEIAARRIELDFDLEKAMPPLRCRPQLLSAVFSALLSNAIQAVNGDGRIDIGTHCLGLDVEVTIRDNGRGMSPDQAATIFEPAFKVDGGRVSSGNWSLFNTRQIVYEHGGDIRLETAEGQGTAISVMLPLIGE